LPIAAIAPAVARLISQAVLVVSTAYKTFLLGVAIVAEGVETAMGRILMDLLSVSFSPIVHGSSTRPDKLRSVRVRLVESLLQLELFVTVGIKDDPAAIPRDFLYQSLFVNVYPTQIRLDNLADIHVREHGPDALAHAIVPLPHPPRPSLAVSRDDVDALHRSELVAVPQVRDEAFLEPPPKGSLASAKRKEV
jgi:hypothetical protein